MGVFSLGWTGKAVASALGVVPVFLAIPFFAKNFQVRPEAFMPWYFLGAALGVGSWICLDGRAADLFRGREIVLPIVAIGLTFGAVTNYTLFQSIGFAPNPGLPPVIFGSASIVLFVLSAVLANQLPQFFNPVRTDLDRILGILLVLAGLFLVAGGWPTVRALFGK